MVALKYLAQIRKTKGDYDGAENMLWRAHRLKEREKGATHSETTSLMISLAGLARSRGDHKISANLFKRVVEAKAGQDPESVALANALHHLGCAYKSLEEWDSAELAFRHSLQILKKHRQAGHKDLTAEMENLIVVLREKVRPLDGCRFSKQLPKFRSLTDPGPSAFIRGRTTRPVSCSCGSTPWPKKQASRNPQRSEILRLTGCGRKPSSKRHAVGWARRSSFTVTCWRT